MSGPRPLAPGYADASRADREGWSAFPAHGGQVRALGVSLEDPARTAAAKARTSLRALLGEAIARRPNENGEHREAVLADRRQQLLAVAATSLKLKDGKWLVAGEGFEPSTFGL